MISVILFLLKIYKRYNICTCCIVKYPWGTAWDSDRCAQCAMIVCMWLAMCLLSGFISLCWNHSEIRFWNTWFQPHLSSAAREHLELYLPLPPLCVTELCHSLCSGCFYAAPSLESSFVLFFFSQLFLGIYIYEGGFHPKITKNYSPGCL